MSNITQITRKLGWVLTKNSPTILTGLGIVGLVATTAEAIRATPKALELMRDEQCRLDADFLTTKEKIICTWKCYVPTAIMGLITIGCIFGANRINLRRNAVLVSLYGLSEAAMKEYQAKVVDMLGKGKEKKIKDDIKKDRILANPVSDKELIMTGRGDSLCYDALSGRYFKSDIELIRQSLNKLSRDLMSEMFIDLNHVYSELGLKGTKIGETIGWHIDDGLIEPDFSSQLTENGIPCLVLDYVTEPRFNHNYY